MKWFLAVLTLWLLVVTTVPRAAVINMTPGINTAYVRTNTDTLRTDGYSDTLGVLGATYVGALLKTVIWGDTVWVWIEASLDGENWANTDSNGDSLYITGTGNTLLIYPYVAATRYYRLKFRMETADSTTKILPFFKVGY